MELTHSIGYLLALLVGMTLGLIGSGGSILTVPILVYILAIEPVLATAYSLFIVGTTALVGGIQKARQHLVDFKKVLLFGFPTVLSVFFTRKFLVPSLPDVLFENHFLSLKKTLLIMLVFAVVMLVAATKMIRSKSGVIATTETKNSTNYLLIFVQGLFIGLVAGFVGAGGGFLIIPALLFLGKTPMKIAVGTSLFIIAMQSLLGFIGDIRPDQKLDWHLLVLFSAFSVSGIFIGNYLSKKIDGNQLKVGFGWLVLLMGVFIIVKEVAL